MTDTQKKEIPKLDFDLIQRAGYIDFIGNDFAIFKDLPRTQFAKDPVRLAPTVFCLVLQGTANIRVNMRDFRFGANELVTFISQHIIENLSVSADFSALFIVVSPSFIRDCIPHQEMAMPMSLRLVQSPALSLSQEECLRIQEYFSLLQARTHLSAHPYQKNILRSLITTVFYDVVGILQRMPEAKAEEATLHKQAVFTEFLRLVADNCTRERSVKFYAEQMCYTPKYLSSIAKSLTDRTALEWIEDYTIIEARTLLRSTSLSIQEIAYRLNFPSQSFFGKYFKQNTGMSPGQYRRMC